MNRSELKYASCKGLLEEPYLTGNSIISTFSRNVAELTGGPANPATTTLAITATTGALKELKLDALVGSVVAALRTGETEEPRTRELPENWRESIGACDFNLALEELRELVSDRKR